MGGQQAPWFDRSVSFEGFVENFFPPWIRSFSVPLIFYENSLF